MKQIQSEAGNPVGRLKPVTDRGFRLPAPVYLFNRLGRAFERLGLSPANRSEESLMAAARRRTGLSDWGDDSFREPLGILLESLRKDARLNLLGWIIIHESLTKNLVNRLLIQDELKRHPEILQVPIERPLFIVSMPRTGTTLLQNLLSQDQTNRSLLFWELMSPAPSPEPRTRDIDPRIAKAEKILWLSHKLMPEWATMHPMDAKTPEECFPLLENSFVSYSFAFYGVLPRYLKWIEEQDMVPPYRYYRQQLQLLQFRFPQKRWVLKAPLHMLCLDALLSVFPDACVVQTHRDPLKVIPSACSLVDILQRVICDRVDVDFYAPKWLDFLTSMVEHYSHVRDSADSARFFDVHYKDLVQDPLGTVRRVYEHFGYGYEARFEERMREWLAANPQNKHGTHRYCLEQFGMNPDMVNSRFATYCERFKISPE